MTKENSMWNINLKKLAGLKELISALEKYHFIAETIHKDMFWFSHERNGVLVIDYARGQENIIRLDYRIRKTPFISTLNTCKAISV